MTTNKTVDCIIHKAIDLRKGESLDAFRRKLGDQGQKFVLSKLNIAKGSAWPVEVFKDFAVFSVFDFNKREDSRGMHAVKFSRQSTTGDFEFSDMTEVERVVGFQTKTGTSVAKAKDGEPEREQIVGDYVKKSTNLWSGVV